MYSGYGIAFEWAGLCCFGNYFVRNVVIFSAGNSSSSHKDNREITFLGEGLTENLNGIYRTYINLVLIFIKKIQKFCLSLHCNHDNRYFFINGKEIYKFKADNKNVIFPSQFCLVSISNKFAHPGTREVSFKVNVYDFSVNNNAINKSYIFNVHKYLVVRSKTK